MPINVRIVAALCFMAPVAWTQAPRAGPLVLLLPASTRATGLGDAFVALRDDAAIFYNPALINPTTNGLYGTFVRYASNGTMGVLSNAVAVGTLNLGWGVEVLEFKARGDAAYPFAPMDVVRAGSRDALSLAAAVGANTTVKGFKAGVGMKYAEDRVDGLLGASGVTPPLRKGVLLGDAGLSHPFMSGTAALAVQNMGDDSRIPLPIQTTLGWTRGLNTSQLDFVFAAEVSERNNWMGGGGGAEVGYGWIEGWSAALRAGLRRTETSAQRPLSVGGTLNADHLALDYALEFFEHSGYAHHLSLRWR
ncbi:MAG: hypothetical protein JWM95_2948 [Gemmatimonadetes bacterium]|nr:hypothetical protein [Gemmatimonadota bacterium]